MDFKIQFQVLQMQVVRTLGLAIKLVTINTHFVGVELIALSWQFNCRLRWLLDTCGIVCHLLTFILRDCAKRIDAASVPHKVTFRPIQFVLQKLHSTA